MHTKSHADHHEVTNRLFFVQSQQRGKTYVHRGTLKVTPLFLHLWQMRTNFHSFTVATCIRKLPIQKSAVIYIGRLQTK